MRRRNPADLLLSDEASAADCRSGGDGLDQPIYVQYLRFLANIASGNLASLDIPIR
jgi:ABC-type dipeptide/oligopeptide/nickel transport system permease component